MEIRFGSILGLRIGDPTERQIATIELSRYGAKARLFERVHSGLLIHERHKLELDSANHPKQQTVAAACVVVDWC